MLQSVEAIIETNGTVHLLEPILLPTRMRAIVTVLEVIQETTVPRKQSLRDSIGALKHSTAFAADPVAIQQAMRNDGD